MKWGVDGESVGYSLKVGFLFSTFCSLIILVEKLFFYWGIIRSIKFRGVNEFFRF